MGTLARILFAGPNRRTLDTNTFAGLLKVLRGNSNSDPITPTSAMQIAAVYACVSVIAKNVATLPLVLMEYDGTVRQPATAHPLYNLLRYLPNPEMTSIQLRMCLMGHLVTHGNAYAQIIYDGAGRRRELWPLRPDRITIERDRNDGKHYRYEHPTKGSIPLAGWEVMHITGFGFDGEQGYSPIAMARRTFETKQRMEDYANNFWDNDASPGVVLRHPGRLTDKGYARLLKSWDDRHRGATNAGRTAILEEGMDLSTLSLPQSDAQFLESQKFTRQEIAALFGVPSHMINDLDRATFSNIEEQAQEFVDYTLMPYLELWQQAIYRDLLTPAERTRYYAHHRTQALLRGNHTTRAQFYQSGLQWGWFSPNEVRNLEDLNPIDAGDGHYMPLNQAPLGTQPAAPLPTETITDDDQDQV